MSTGILHFIETIQYNRQTGATYALVLSDKSKCVEINDGSANTLEVPTNATVAFPIGTWVLVTQYGAGQTTIAGAGGVTIRSANSANKIVAQYGVAMLMKVATDEWYLSGNIIN